MTEEMVNQVENEEEGSTTTDGVISFKVKVPKKGLKGEFTYNIGADLDEAVSKFGHDVVYSYFVRAAVVLLQDVARRQMDSGKSNEGVQEHLNTYTLGVVTRTGGGKVDPFERIKSLVASGEITKEEAQAAIQKLVSDIFS